MIRFLRDFELDRLSFWVGFVGGILFWWFVWLLRPMLRRALTALAGQIRQAREGLTLGIEIRHRNDTLRLVQGLHIAAPLFALDEVRVEPRIMPPPPRVQPSEDPPWRDIVSQAIPYLPDSPELGGAYGAATLSFPEALSLGANLVLIGQPGSGKTTALADLASQLARGEVETEGVADLVPIYLHVGELVLPPESPDEPIDPLEPLVGAVTAKASTLTARGLPDYLESLCEDGGGLLLLDGLDELPPPQVDRYAGYIGQLLKRFPALRLVAAAAVDYFDGLVVTQGLFPVALASWNQNQRIAYIERWGKLWTRYVLPEIWSGADPGEAEPEATAEPVMLTGWLTSSLELLTPLELTLKVWAAYAGDMLGGTSIDSLEAYLRRMTVGIRNARPALEQLALQITVTMNPLMPRNEAGRWVAEFDQSGPDPTAGDSSIEASLTAEQQPRVSVRRTLPDLLGSGLLLNRGDDRLSVAHPVIQGYLAGCALSRIEGAESLISQPRWSGRTLALGYLAACGDASQIARNLLERTHPPLHHDILMVSRWLRYGVKSAPWRSVALRQLAKMLQDESLALGLRARILTSLAGSVDGEVAALFRHLLNSEYAGIRQLGALGLGLLKDTKSIQELAQILYDRTPNVQRAACLALVSIGSPSALETIASALLQGDEGLRQAAAEAFANHPEEGHPLLQDGAGLDDLLVRRAVVFGLARVRENWSMALLEKMQVEDGQWVVRNAAMQTLEDLRKPNPLIPQPYTPLHETPWLIAFAGERGLGLTSGKAARELLHRAMREGNPEERMAAMERMRRVFDQTFVLDVYQLVFGNDLELREAAYDLLWHMDASGIDLPPPTQFGFA